MRLVFAITVAALTVGPGAAWADSSGQYQNPFMNTPVKETVYATDQHMGFSIRTTLIQWLGGVPIAKERDVSAAEREKWWGKSVPSLPADAIKPADR